MKTRTLAILVILSCYATAGFGQKGPARRFGDPVLTDTLSTLFIPTRYNEEFLSTNKIAFWNDLYANIIVYNFKTDSYKRLFEKDTYISALQAERWYSTQADKTIENITPKWVFLQVKTTDTNKNNRIDEKDPSVLFAVSLDGQDMKQLTTTADNVVYIESFHKQGFMLIKLQRDSNHDGSFKHDDEEFYFKKINLSDLSFGKEIPMQ